MLIIFDLDDTLIDTSGFVTPFKLKMCLDLFIKQGAFIPDYEIAYQELLFISEKSERSKDALKLFLEKNGADVSLLKDALEQMRAPLPNDFFIPTTPNAKEVLSDLKKRHTLALVTAGYRPFQSEKLKKAGIDSSTFSNITVPEDFVKRPFYEEILREHQVPLEKVLVCGDRVATDLKPAHELGLKTVHMRWGRGKETKTPSWVDWSITNLRELTRIVQV